MFMRVVYPQVKPDSFEEVAKVWKQVISPRAQSNPHFRHGYMAKSKDGAKVVAVTLFDELPAEAMFKEVTDAMRAALGDLMTGPPAMDDYEIIAEI